MRILVISDTHGRVEKARELIREKGPFDLGVHLGDFAEDAKRLERETGLEFRFVKGNMDGGTKEDFSILSTDGGDILLVHGHIQGVKRDLTALMYTVEEKGCKGAFFGHTHVPFLREEAGLYLLNPGSLSLPHLDKRGSYAIVQTGKGRLDGTICYI